jgi:chromate transporter
MTLLLFWEFFKTGLFSVGGGLATLPFLYDIADRYTWFDRAMLVDMMAVAESTPGPIGINTATFAGFRAAGILGGVIATVGLALPSYLIPLGVSKVLSRFSQNETVRAVFYGLRPAVAGMIAAAGLSVARVALLTDTPLSGWQSLPALPDWPAVVLFAVLYFLYTRYKKHPIVYIAGAAVIGILLKM